MKRYVVECKQDELSESIKNKLKKAFDGFMIYDSECPELSFVCFVP